MKNIFKSKNVYIILLLVLTLCAFPLAFSKKGIVYLNKVTKTSIDKSGYNQYGYYEEDNYYDDDYDYGYYDDDNYYNYDYDNDDYDYGYYGYDNDDYDYEYYGYDNDDYEYYDNDDYNEYDNDDYSSRNSLVGKKSSYNKNTAPGVEYISTSVVYVNDTYNLLSNISASHSYYGDVTNNIEVIYHNIIGDVISDNYIRVTTPGKYKIVYKACSYPGSSYCRTVTKTLVVKDGSSTNKYSKEPVWKNTGDYSCTSSNYKCDTYSVPAPTATDPYSGKKLTVRLISGEVDQYRSGTYTLVYEAYTSNNVRGIVYKNVIVNYRGNTDDDTVLPSAKYITSYYTEYYDDGLYSGYLKSDNKNSNTIKTKFIDNYEWTNKVKYTYECTAKGNSGTDGWTYISTDTSDNNPSVEYSKNGYSGTLNKKSFYCKEGCTEKLIPELGVCKNLGERKQIYRTFVGVYYGNAYSEFNNYFGQETYSGYVYLKR